MSVENFRELCKKGKFYHFDSIEKWEKKIDWCGKDVSHINFERGLQYRKNMPPTNYFAYGISLIDKK